MYDVHIGDKNLRIVESDAVLSLFSGAGGFSLGFALAGLKPACGAEIDKDACGTYEKNIGSTCHNVDLSSISPKFFSAILGNRAPFAVIGGPPCQGFSTAGLRSNSDPRNRLIFNYFRIVNEVKPRWFLFENVEGLLTSGNGQALAELVSQFLEIGYSVRLQKVNFAAFGVPQTRKRLIIVGNRIGSDFHFPEETHSFVSGKSKKLSEKPMAPSLREAIVGLGQASLSRKDLVAYSADLPLNSFDSIMRANNLRGTVTEHFYRPAKDVEMFRLLQPGQSMKDLPEEFWHESFKRRAFRRVSDGTPTEKRGGAPSGIKRLQGGFQSLTITGAASREFIHPLEHRLLTLRECARIQTFPDNFDFAGNNASVAQQIGNAVPPLAAHKFAEHLLEVDGSFGADNATPRAYNRPRLLGFVLTDASGMSPALKSTESLLTRLMA